MSEFKFQIGETVIYSPSRPGFEPLRTTVEARHSGSDGIDYYYVYVWEGHLWLTEDELVSIGSEGSENDWSTDPPKHVKIEITELDAMARFSRNDKADFDKTLHAMAKDWDAKAHGDLHESSVQKAEREALENAVSVLTKAGQANNVARKNDAGKPPLSMIPREALEEMAKAFAYGAAKYSRGNFRQSGMKWSRLTDAALRHITAFANGEWLDPESGNSHLSHALASLAMLAFQAKHHPEENDLYAAIEENNDE